MNKGLVKIWISDRRCGFITCKEINKDILVKSSNLKGTIYLEKGEKVQFKIKKTPRGLTAVDVKPINP